MICKFIDRNKSQSNGDILQPKIKKFILCVLDTFVFQYDFIMFEINVPGAQGALVLWEQLCVCVLGTYKTGVPKNWRRTSEPPHLKWGHPTSTKCHGPWTPPCPKGPCSCVMWSLPKECLGWCESAVSGGREDDLATGPSVAF